MPSEKGKEEMAREEYVTLEVKAQKLRGMVQPRIS